MPALSTMARCTRCLPTTWSTFPEHRGKSRTAAGSFSQELLSHTRRNLTTSVSSRTFLGFHGEWEVETNRFGHYLVFNASERLATDVVDALEAGGLSVQRWDVSHRPTGEGKFYDWFARLRYKGSHEEVMAQISAVFSPASAEPTAAPAPAPSVSPLEDLAAQVEQLVDLTAELRERLSTSEVGSFAPKRAAHWPPRDGSQNSPTIWIGPRSSKDTTRSACRAEP